MIFCIFCQVNLTGSGLLNRTGAEIGNLIKSAKKSVFIIEKIKNTGSTQLWLWLL